MSADSLSLLNKDCMDRAARENVGEVFGKSSFLHHPTGLRFSEED